MLTIEPICAYDDNYIWLISDAGNNAFVVDPGDAAPVLAVLRERELTLAGILITHHHFDHVGGLQALREAYSPVVYGPDNPAIEGLDSVVRAGDTVDVLGHHFDVVAVPGHTLDHIAYFHAAAQPLLFCGDTLFAGGCGRVFEGTAEMMHASLQRLAALPPNTRVYCAHEYTLANLDFARAVEPGNAALLQRIAEAEASRDQGQPTVPSELSLEFATNPFLRCAAPELLDSLRQQNRLEGEAPASVFATVRGWKDNF
jgi:hydroxyacylglutathione hydrolase